MHTITLHMTDGTAQVILESEDDPTEDLENALSDDGGWFVYATENGMDVVNIRHIKGFSVVRTE